MLKTLQQISIFAFLAAMLVFGAVAFFYVNKSLRGPPRTRADFQELAENAKSSWDPFGETGARRWQRLLFVIFLLICVLNFLTSGPSGGHKP